MNIRQFIDEVRKNRALWDQKNKYYHNKKALNDGWRDIAKKFGVEVIVAKQKWKNLRDTFRVELKKTKRYGSCDPGTQTRSLWGYYEDMYFLKDSLRTRRTLDLIEVPTTSESPENIAEVKLERDSLSFSPEPLDDSPEENITSNILIQNVTSLHGDDADSTHEQWNKRGVKRRKIEAENNGEGNDDEQDDDLLFFRSLMPFVKKLDQDKKLLFRMNVQQMLYNQLYTNNN